MSNGETQTMETTTWIKSSRFCSTEIHRTDSACPDCTDNGQCIACGATVADGAPHLIRAEDGEVIHPECRA